MNPMFDYSNSRRSFVKNTLATTVSMSFAGLIRAHGQQGGGETTTWNPDAPTHATYDSGETTTWDPDQTTIRSTDGETTTTWDPDETTPVATAPPSRTVLVSILVEFTNTVPRKEDSKITTNDQGWWRWSGRVWEGTLTCWLQDCTGGELIRKKYRVKSGGYNVSSVLKWPVGMPKEGDTLGSEFWSAKPWESGSDTPWPPGSYMLSTAFTVGTIVKGYCEYDDAVIITIIDGKNVRRGEMMVHFKSRPDGSAGCIVFVEESGSEFREFCKWMNARRLACDEQRCPNRMSDEAGQNKGCIGVSSVPMLVTYRHDIRPVYKLSDHALQSQNPVIPVAIPVEPET